jgi:hypothetical protein
MHGGATTGPLLSGEIFRTTRPCSLSHPYTRQMQSWLLELSVIGHKNGSAIEVSAAVVDKFRIALLEINAFFNFSMRSIRSVGDWMNNSK